MRVSTMKLNTTQKTIAIVGAIALVSLALFPPWWQAAQNEISYRKDLGRAFALKPPRAEPVDCYFVNCQVAPASYFHVLLYRDLFFEQLAAVAGVAIIALWMFRERRGGTRASLESPKTRLGFSLLVALAVAPEGKFPLASDLVDIPRLLFHKNELLLLPMILTIAMYLAISLCIYALVTAAIWLRSRRSGVALRGTS